MAEPMAIGIDVGGTNVRGAMVLDDGSLAERHRAASPRGDGRALVAAIVDVVRALDRADLPHGIGVAGIVGRDGTLRYSPNHEVGDVPIGTWVREATGVVPAITNDANAAALAEVRFGAGRGHRDVVMLTIGTGIGGGYVRDGRLVEGAHGFAAEFGHMVVLDGGRRQRGGTDGAFEAYASGTAIGRTAAERLAAGDGRESGLRDLAPDELTGKAVTTAALTGDAFAGSVLEEVGRWLGIGLVNVIVALDPELVVIGGGASLDAAPWLLPVARRELGERVLGAQHRNLPDLVLAQLGDDAGTIGAAALAHDERLGGRDG